MVTGFATIGHLRVMILAEHKGRDVHERAKCNFGSPQPEGYRKALWKMKLAEKLGLPVVTLIDTKGAAAAVEAEERGQSQAIAYNLMTLAGLKVPVVSVVIGEGGSGGALGIGVGDRLLIQEFAYFSVIAPEACASILWRDAARKEEAASALKLTAPDLLRLGVVDRIVPEPLGAAHRQPLEAAKTVKACILEELDALLALPLPSLLEKRYQRIRAWGRFEEKPPEAEAGEEPLEVAVAV
jgi:acetyl-CoA carboxylase carboxyl transferase subunit alpha